MYFYRYHYQIFRYLEHSEKSGYVNTISMYYIQIHIHKLYQLYVEMKAHIRFHYFYEIISNTLAKSWLNATLQILARHELKGHILRSVASHYIIPPTTFMSLGGGGLLLCNEGPDFNHCTC